MMINNETFGSGEAKTVADLSSAKKKYINRSKQGDHCKL